MNKKWRLVLWKYCSLRKGFGLGLLTGFVALFSVINVMMGSSVEASQQEVLVQGESAHTDSATDTRIKSSSNDASQHEVLVQGESAHTDSATDTRIKSSSNDASQHEVLVQGESAHTDSATDT
ncbi:MAG: hypothetical protein SWX82_00590, partial [Cyanobacteriota bacterium]|nr:hypothetical protein [Cyanobacteriota bacterium]